VKSKVHQKRILKGIQIQELKRYPMLLLLVLEVVQEVVVVECSGALSQARVCVCVFLSPAPGAGGY
jgi:hypothetical protein